MTILIHTPWNKDRIIGQEKPFQISHMWGIRIRLELEGRTRDLTPFNLGLDSKLRGCDLVKLEVINIVTIGIVTIFIKFENPKGSVHLFKVTILIKTHLVN
ncbi:hypothetical protein [Alteromonas stellipolaris]|uniref:hypothetical protein n=1 Tax=Alteromonas stellipolaris TaxID=233316 RepID=UPI0027362A6D|nr:hypothetical protein [Alteromonas stellipolaris]MDP2536625.1 hypothetical protein [Alteromonas stellipolaris]